MTITLKTGNTWPYVEAVLAVDGVVLDLTGCTVKFVMARKGTGEVVLESAATILDIPSGKVQYSWDPVDTATDGHFYGEFVVTFSSGKKTTVPNDQYIEIVIYRSLKAA